MRFVTLAWLALLGQAAYPMGDEQTFRDWLNRRAQTLRPSAAELRWQEVPWLRSLVEARETARQEKRPILVWAADDDPFGRC
jgi:hypothetical protein